MLAREAVAARSQYLLKDIVNDELGRGLLLNPLRQLGPPVHGVDQSESTPFYVGQLDDLGEVLILRVRERRR